MWPSQRRGSIGLDSRQRTSQARRRDRRGIKPIVTLLEERTLLSTLNLTVTTLQDDAVTPITGQTTLRDAITTANADMTDSQEVINFAANLSGTINLMTALPNLATNISINGPGASSLTVSGGGSSSSFSVFTVNIGVTASISELTISNGNASYGGGVDNSGNLTLANDTISGNSAQGDGGGVFNAGTATLTNDTISGNSAQFGGGGVYNYYFVVTLTNDILSGNRATTGGGVDNNGNLTLTNDTISENWALFYGGGICVSNEGMATLTNDTIYGNSAQYDGGGVFNAGTTTLANDTISGNSAQYGGGVDNGGTATLNNTIVANSPSGGDIFGSVSGSNNLIDDGSSGLEPTTNLVDVDPMLDPLGNYGGPTQTMALLSGSPAIGAGSTALAVDANGVSLQYDQRGIGYHRTKNDTVDIGAYEVQLTTPTLTVTDAGGGYNGTPYAAVATINSGHSLEGVTPTLDYQQSINGVWNDLSANAPINAGSYDVTVNFAGSTDYAAASQTVGFSITKANADVFVGSYNIVYDGQPHTDTSFIMHAPFTGLGINVNSTTHTNVGTYTDTWTFTDPTGNYNNASGTVIDTITKANTTFFILGYNTFYNAVSHTATGEVYGVNGSNLNSLYLNGTTHTGVGTYTDTWTFTDITGNYNNASGVVKDTITPSKTRMVRETIQLPILVKAKVSEFVPIIKDVKVVERVLVHGKWTNKTVLVPELVNIRKTVTVTVTKMVKKTVMVKVYYGSLPRHLSTWPH